MVNDMKIENYENLITYLKLVLDFYANPKTYQDDIISKDLGFMAKEALHKIDETNEYNTIKLSNTQIRLIDVK